MQPSMPPLVRAWLPDRIGFATAVYTNGLLIGEVLPVALTLPLVLPLVGGSWRARLRGVGPAMRDHRADHCAAGAAPASRNADTPRRAMVAGLAAAA